MLSRTDTADAYEVETLVELLTWRAAQQPDREAYTFLVDGETEAVHLTYKELDGKARSIAARLQRQALPGDRALLLYPPGLDYIAAFFGCLYAGMIAIPAYPPRISGPDRNLNKLRSIVTNARPRFALTTASFLSGSAALLAQVPEFQAMAWLATDRAGSDSGQAWQDPGLDSSTVAFLQYTSGSTTAPRGVMVSHSNLLHNLGLIEAGFGIEADWRGVIWLPPYHDMGLIGGVLQPLYSGTPVTLMSPVAFLQRPLRWLQAIARYSATCSGGPNFAYELCIRKITPEQCRDLDLSSWKVAFTGAEPVRLRTLQQFRAAFASSGFRMQSFYPCYGLAEATLIVSGGVKTELPVVLTVRQAELERRRAAPAGPGERQTETLVGCGQVLGDQAVAIVEPDSCIRCLPGEVGEIWIAGPSITRGYWNQPAETECAFRAFLVDSGEGPFLRTGDLGFIHEGQLFVTGRLKDLIIIRGRNIYPQDIEQTVRQSHPALNAGSGAAFPVEIGGEERLVIVQEVDRHFRPAGAAEIATTICQAIAEQHELQVYDVLLLKPGSIPRTSSGKIQHYLCRHNYLAKTWAACVYYAMQAELRPTE